MPQTDRRRADLQRGRRIGFCGCGLAGRDSGHSCCGSSRYHHRDPKKFVAAPRGLNLPVASVASQRRAAQTLRTHHARARLPLHRRNADLKRPRRAIPLHAPHRRSAIGSRRRDLGSAASAEHSPGTLRRQSEAHRRTLDWLSGFIRHQHRQPACSARPNRVRNAVSLGHAQGENRRSIRPPSQHRRQASRQHSGRFQDHVNGVRRTPRFSPLPFKSRGRCCNPLNSHPAQNA